MASLADQIVAVHRSLDAAGIDHAFGGALALAWCTQQARGTIDIDVNVFVPPDRAEDVVAALPGGVPERAEVGTVERPPGQVRRRGEDNPDRVAADEAPHE